MRPTEQFTTSRRTWAVQAGALFGLLLTVLIMTSPTSALAPLAAAPAAPRAFDGATSGLLAGGSPALPPLPSNVHSHPAGGGPWSAWSNLSVSNPSGAIVGPINRTGAAMAYDPVDNFTLLFSGGTGVSSNGQPVPPFWNDTWEWNYSVSAKRAEWYNLSQVNSSRAGDPFVNSPPAREFGDLVWDAHDGYFVLYGGLVRLPKAQGSGSYYLNDTWTFNGKTKVWTNITSTAHAPYDGSTKARPTGLYYPTMVYDPVAQAAILFGGGVGDNTTTVTTGEASHAMAETWAFYHGSWVNLTGTSALTGAPPARDEAAMAWDAYDHEVVLYGGQNVKDKIMNDTWILTGSWGALTWTNITASVSDYPNNGRRGAAFAPDMGDGGFDILFGGTDSVGLTDYNNSTYLFRNNNWTNLTGWVGTSPFTCSLTCAYFGETGATQLSATYDGVTNDILIFGGTGSSSSFTTSPLQWTWGYRWTNVSLTAAANTSNVPLHTPVQISATAHGGNWTYTYTYGGLPPGCVSQNTSLYVCTPTQIGEYNVTVNVTDGYGTKGPTAKVSFLVYEALNSTLSLSSPGVDYGRSVYVNDSVAVGSGSSGGHTYLYSGLPPGCSSANSPSFQCKPGSSAINNSYNITVQVTDSAGDKVVNGPVELKVYPALTLALTNSPTKVMDGGFMLYMNATATGGDLPYTYIWTGLPTNCTGGDVAKIACVPTPATEETDFVNVSMHDGTGYTLKQGFELQVWPQLNASISASPLSGPEPLTVNFKALVSGGDKAVDFTWLWPNGQKTLVQNTTEQFTTEGMQTIDFWVNDSIGTSVERNLTIDVQPPIPKLTAQIQYTPTAGIVDDGQSVVFTANASGGLPPYSYNWQPLPPGCTASTDTMTCTPSTVGTLYASVTVNDTSGRTATAQGSVIVHAKLQLTVQQQAAASCGATTVNLTAAPDFGTGPYTVAWKFPSGATSTGTTASYQFPVGNSSVNATVTDNVGATASKIVYVEVSACSTSSTNNNGITSLDIAALVIAAVVVVGLALYFLRRGGGSEEEDVGGAAPPPSAPEALYGEENAAPQEEYIYGSESPPSPPTEGEGTEAAAGGNEPAGGSWPPSGGSG